MTKSARLKRIRQTIAALFYLLIVVGLSWLTLTRWNGVPADPTGTSASLPLDPDKDRTNELVAALAAIPPMPALTIPPPPPGMQWSLVNVAGSPLEIGDALRGEWTPETRPNLQGIITYLESQPVQDAIDALAAIEPGYHRRESISMSDVIRAVQICVGHARLQHAVSGNIDGALDDIETAFQIGLICMNSDDLLLTMTSSSCLSTASEELRCMAYERSLTSAQATRAMEIIHNATLSKKAVWDHRTAVQCSELRQLLDMSYTNDGNGNGWLALSHMSNAYQPSQSMTPRSKVWNLFSPLFNDRRTVEAKIELYRRANEEIGRLPYADAKAAIPTVHSHVKALCILDAPLSQMAVIFTNAYEYDCMLGRVIAARGADTVTVALSVYRHDHGEYPPSLDVLLGGYLETIPLDPYIDQPLRYYRQPTGDDYVLYAVGSNQIDDGGVWPLKTQAMIRKHRGRDLIFRHTRGEPYAEPALEAVKP